MSLYFLYILILFNVRIHNQTYLFIIEVSYNKLNCILFKFLKIICFNRFDTFENGGLGVTTFHENPSIIKR